MNIKKLKPFIVSSNYFYLNPQTLDKKRQYILLLNSKLSALEKFLDIFYSIMSMENMNLKKQYWIM